MTLPDFSTGDAMAPTTKPSHVRVLEGAYLLAHPTTLPRFSSAEDDALTMHNKLATFAGLAGQNSSIHGVWPGTITLMPLPHAPDLEGASHVMWTEEAVPLWKQSRHHNLLAAEEALANADTTKICG